VGTVYRLASPAAGKTAWKETVLHSFDQIDGSNPFSNLIADTQGNLYGTTVSGDPISANSLEIGGVFRLTP